VLHAARAVGRGNARVELTAYAGADDLDGDFTQFGDSSRAGGGTFEFDWSNQVVGVSFTNVWRDGARLPSSAGPTASGPSSACRTRASPPRWTSARVR
jgi:hypothetical protein